MVEVLKKKINEPLKKSRKTQIKTEDIHRPLKEIQEQNQLKETKLKMKID